MAQSVAGFLSSLEKEREKYAAIMEEHRIKIAELDALIPGIRARIPKEFEQDNVVGGIYEGMSLRKALLKLLALRGKDTVSATAVITSELLAGGVKSSAESFTSNVSATLSVMKSKHEEVSYAEDGWSITEKGLINASQTQNILRGKYNWKKKRIKL